MTSFTSSTSCLSSCLPSCLTSWLSLLTPAKPRLVWTGVCRVVRELTGGAGLRGAGGDSAGMNHHVLQGQQDVRRVLSVTAFIGTKTNQINTLNTLNTKPSLDVDQAIEGVHVHVRVVAGHVVRVRPELLSKRQLREGQSGEQLCGLSTPFGGIRQTSSGLVDLIFNYLFVKMYFKVIIDPEILPRNVSNVVESGWGFCSFRLTRGVMVNRGGLSVQGILLRPFAP